MVHAMTTHRPHQTIAYVGNFAPPHSTENHVAETLRRMGHTVVPLQENVPAMWADLCETLPAIQPDVVLWTRTGWDPPVSAESQLALLAMCHEDGVPVVGFHLDRWWGLERQHQVDSEPFFQCDIVATADGGHDQMWLEHGVNHLWSPPAVAEWQCGFGTPRAEYRTEVAFVGSWDSYHHEWPWRRQMVRQLQARYGSRMRCWPERGRPAVRGSALRDLYASATVVVGDSCLAPAADGGPMTRYWSDRVPETLGRAGLLVHPNVVGLDGEYVLGEELLGVEPQNIEAMYDVIDMALAMPVEVQHEIRRNALRAVLGHHTYRHRMETLLDAVHELAERAS